MAVVLRIKFTGLITFVPDPLQERLVALLPITGAMGNAGVHQHHGELSFDRKYLGHAISEEGEHDGDQSTSNRERIPLGRTELNFSQLRGMGTVINPPKEAMLLDKLTKRPIDRNQVSEFPRSTVFSQVILPGANTITAGTSVEWFVDGRIETLSNEIRWERELPEEERNVLIWIRFMNSTQYQAIRLRALSDDDVIELEITHVPHPDDEDDTTLGYEAVHFASYYELYLPPAPIIVLPILAVAPGANVFSCMTSQVSLGA